MKPKYEIYAPDASLLSLEQAKRRPQGYFVFTIDQLLKFL